MSMIEPLDFETIFVNLFAGSPEIFAFFSMIFIAGLAAYFKMSNYLTMIMFVLFAIVMSFYLSGLYVLVVLISALATYYGLSRIITR